MDGKHHRDAKKTSTTTDKKKFGVKDEETRRRLKMENLKKFRLCILSQTIHTLHPLTTELIKWNCSIFLLL